MGKFNFSDRKVYLCGWLLLFIITIGLAFFKLTEIIFVLSAVDMLVLQVIVGEHYPSEVDSERMFGMKGIDLRFFTWQKAHKHAKWWLLVPSVLVYVMVIGYVLNYRVNFIPRNFALPLMFLIISGLAYFFSSVYIAEPGRFFRVMTKLQRINIIMAALMIIAGLFIFIDFRANIIGFLVGAQLVMWGSYVFYMRQQSVHNPRQMRLVQYYSGKTELVVVAMIILIKVVNSDSISGVCEAIVWIVIFGITWIIADLLQQVKAVI
ncbi:hypothetical protein EQG49_06870 [Periweissella cryptocerci]|uniref:Uncharacterized protein n=1 Tax=Periweissella cryptocerci TaxID=2506420 RepID=A0A4P6YU09_9LACO|nr:hypothetical protein [Periweissella cryptocerci]QBO36200.1 hypothetical protein EQG49_06870 [Periweissella cryptocerci]